MKILKNKIGLCSDIHIGLHQSSDVWHKISLDFARQLKQTLINKDINDLIILGDTLNDRNEISGTTINVLEEFFRILEDFNIIVIVGNHDAYYSKRADVNSVKILRGWPNITIIDKPVSINQFDKKLTFCPWATPLENIPQSDIIFGHFEVNTFKMNGGKLCDGGVDPQDLLKKAPLIITGHFHKTEKRDYKDGTILYVGSPYEQNWGEAGDVKGIYTLDIYDNTLSFIQNNTSPRHIKMRLSELLAVGKITDNIKNEFKNNIINFIIDTELEQKILDVLLTKLFLLDPISIKTDNIISPIEILSTNEEINFEGIDIKNDIIKFVTETEGVDNKEQLIKYLSGVYDECIKETV